jgi:hypothetical protein
MLRGKKALRQRSLREDRILYLERVRIVASRSGLYHVTLLACGLLCGERNPQKCLRSSKPPVFHFLVGSMSSMEFQLC